MAIPTPRRSPITALARFAVVLMTLLAVMVGAGNTPALAAPGELDPSFAPLLLDKIEGGSALVVQPDGKIVLGGGFVAVNGTVRNNVARFNPDGTLDTSFNPDIGVDGGVIALALQPDGKLLIAGSLTAADGTARSGVARLNADGSLDPSFDPSIDTDSGGVSELVLQPDGKLLIAGFLTAADGTTRSNIARLNANGSLDTSFNPNISPASIVGKLALQPDGKIVFSGGFMDADDKIRENFIKRLYANGSLDSSFNAGSETDGIVGALVLQPDGKIVVSGEFTQVNGTARNGIARLNANGSLDTSFNPDTSPGSTVGELALQPDGKIVFSGGFRDADDTVSENTINRFNPDGTRDSSFDAGSETDGIVGALVLQPDGKIVFSGTFTQVDGTARNGIARLNANGRLDTSFTPGVATAGDAAAVALQPDGKLLVGGNFSQVNATARNRIARINPDGTLDTSFNPGTGANSGVYALVLQLDGKVIIGGDFTEVNGTAHSHIARLNADGSLDTSFNPGTGANSGVYALVLQPDGKLLVGGSFMQVNGAARRSIARLNADGSLDPSFNPGTGADNTVNALALQPDGKVIIGGNFTQVNGAARSHIARLNADGSLDTSFNPGTDADSSVYALTLQPDGKLLVGGRFTQVNGTARGGIARLNADGSLDPSFNPGIGDDSEVHALALQPDGRLLVGGFRDVNRTASGPIVRLNPDGSRDTSFNPGTGANSTVYALAINGNRLVLGGYFTQFNGTPRIGLAQLELGLPAVSLVASPASVAENSATPLVYTVSRTGDTGSALTVNFSLGGTATFGSDYTLSGAATSNASGGTLVIPAGASSAALTVTPSGDSLAEADETVIVTISSGTSYILGSTVSATGTLTNVNAPAPPPTEPTRLRVFLPLVRR